MKLAKVREILELNIKGAGKKMPPDTLIALVISHECVKWRILMEKEYGSWCGPPLPGETFDPDPQ